MLDNQSVEYFLNQLSDVQLLETLAPRKKILKLRTIFREIFTKITENEKQFFSSNFAKVVFSLDKMHTDKSFSSQIKKLNYTFNKAASNQDYKVSEGTVNYAIELLKLLINEFSRNKNENINKELNYFQFQEQERKQKFEHQFIGFLQAVVVRKFDYIQREGYDFASLSIYTNEFDDVTLQVDKKWLGIWKIAWKGALLNLFDVKLESSKELKIQTTSSSLIIIEPDYLVDVTDISECFHSNGYNPYLYFFKKYRLNETTLPLVTGNIANYFFDELISNPEIEFKTLFEKALKYKPLQLFALATKDKAYYKELKETSYNYYNIIRDLIPDIIYDSISVEPSFISPKYGIQGRLDALMEYNEDKTRKDIVELKAGNEPPLDLTNRLAGKIFTSGIWLNHLAQTTCYNLLLDSIFEKRSGTSQILYLKSNKMPLRNAPNIIQMKAAVIDCRNWIVALERSLMLGNYSLFDDFDTEKFGSKPAYLNQDLIYFKNLYNNLSQLERDYFHITISFILRETFAEKIGSDNNGHLRGFSKFWKESLQEKEANYAALTNLKLNHERSDFVNMHLYFEPLEDLFVTSSFRKGDICILYPSDEDSYSNSFRQQLLKVTIKEISSDEIILSLRNKNFNASFFTDFNLWVIEPDFLESSNKKLIYSLYLFLCSENSKKELLLGLRKPEFEENMIPKYEWLSHNQYDIFKKAVSAKDYFLVQGPPGTGKTSYLLKALVKFLYENTKEHLLVLAYTNRAVDEICATISTIEPVVEFLRLGSKESSAFQSYLIAHLAETESLGELYKKIKSTRVIVSTVASVLYNPEIFEILNFDTAIVDEASQILEVQIIGIFSKVRRFIMIGDEKQLPAIVTQSESKLKVEVDSLNSIYFNDLRCSLFERLIRICSHNGWNEAFGMLRYQARMHREIQDFPNKYFYSNNLYIFNSSSWQVSSDNIFQADSDNPLERLLSSHRVLFIESKPEIKAKVNTNEAVRVTALINCIIQTYNNFFNIGTIGVITPYRAQCTEIAKHLTKEQRKLVTIDTVERFQGTEREIIIVSFAVNINYQLRNIISQTEFDGIIVDRKLNVAITRAKQHLIIFGNSGILCKNNIYNNFINFIKERGGYIDYEESKQIFIGL